MDEQLEANRASWNERVSIHASSTFYDVEGWLAERRGPRPQELEILGSVEGLTLVHLQCHFGMDTMQFARAGATVVGLDFSEDAIELARTLAVRAGLDDRARFVCGNVLDGTELLDAERFDVVYVSLGSLCWLPDVARWAQVVASALVPGGRLYLYDVHPMSMTLDDETGRHLAYSYFEEPEGFPDDFPYTYTDGDQQLEHTRTYSWNHSIAEILGALTSQGLAIERFEEHDWTVFRQFPWLTEKTPGRWHIPAGEPRIPLSMTVVARAPS